MDISKYDEAAVLAALYNNSVPLGLGRLHFNPAAMTVEQAAELLKEYRRFDYLYGRVMKVSFFDPARPESEYNKKGWLRGTQLYDRDLGEGAAEAVISKLLPKP